MSKNIHKRHGENIHKMEEIPEKPVLGNSPDVSLPSQGNIPPAQIKRLTDKTTKRQNKKPLKKNKT